MLSKKICSLVFPRYSRMLDIVNYNALLAQWMRQHPGCRRFEKREDYYRHLNHEYLQNQPIDFLEFGVFRGDSIRFWAEMNCHPESRFWGFDTFEGLPEDWDVIFGDMRRGTFDVGGKTPETGDPRITFVKGLFQDTLDKFLEGFEPRNRLVVHIDCDLYSATLFVLTKLDRWLRKGGLILFDEFSSPLHEFRAFEDYAKSYYRKYSAVAAAGYFDHTAIAIES